MTTFINYNISKSQYLSIMLKALYNKNVLNKIEMNFR